MENSPKKFRLLAGAGTLVVLGALSVALGMTSLSWLKGDLLDESNTTTEKERTCEEIVDETEEGCMGMEELKQALNGCSAKVNECSKEMPGSVPHSFKCEEVGRECRKLISVGLDLCTAKKAACQRERERPQVCEEVYLEQYAECHRVYSETFNACENYQTPEERKACTTEAETVAKTCTEAVDAAKEGCLSDPQPPRDPEAPVFIEECTQKRIIGITECERKYIEETLECDRKSNGEVTPEQQRCILAAGENNRLCTEPVYAAEKTCREAVENARQSFGAPVIPTTSEPPQIDPQPSVTVPSDMGSSVPRMTSPVNPTRMPSL